MKPVEPRVHAVDISGASLTRKTADSGAVFAVFLMIDMGYSSS